MDTHGEYKEVVLRTLGRFQLLEFLLKEYIARVYRLISESMAGKVHFDYSAKDIESFALERLLGTFQKLNSNADLLRRMNILRDKRNQLAHRALLTTFPPLHDETKMGEDLNEYKALEAEVTACAKLVIQEVKALPELGK